MQPHVSLAQTDDLGPGRLVFCTAYVTVTHSNKEREPELTEEVGKPWRLVVMDNGHAGSVESHQAQDDPIKHLGFHHVANGDAQKSLFVPEIGGAIHFSALDAATSQGGT